MKMEKFQSLFLELAVSFGIELSPAQTTVYFKYLQHLTEDQFEKAVPAVITNEQRYKAP